MKSKKYKSRKPSFDKPKYCEYCTEPFYVGRSDKKYCCTSCRVAHHQFLKRQNKKYFLPNKTENNLGIINSRDGNTRVLTPLESFLSNLAANGTTQAIEKITGVHNSDVLQAIEELKLYQMRANELILDQNTLLKKIAKQQSEPPNLDNWVVYNL